jgi:hypothetical protein
MNRFALTASAILMLSTTACLDATRGMGELGNIRYSLYTEYDPGTGEITDTPILVNHAQDIYLDLSDRGERAAGDLSTVRHTVSPSDGVTLDYSADDDGLNRIEITVTDPGEYTLSSEVEGDLLDTITLEFDAPAELDAVTWIRSPDTEEFEEPAAVQPAVDEGAQVTFVGIPLDADGERIAGRFEVEISADPEGAVVDAYDIWETHEDHVYGGTSEASVYFIEPGAITLTVSDEANGVDFAQTFDVSAW